MYRNAPGQYSDNAQGMNMPAGFTGRPNQQNLAAAANLAAAQQPSSARGLAEAALSQPSGVQAPVVRNSTNDWAARNNLRNLEVSASSITNQPGFSRGGRGYVPPAVAAYQAGLQTDAALQQAQPGIDQAAMRENAGIQREGMQQQGATTRTGMQERGSMGRTMAQAALEQQKINQAGESQGFANRAAAQSEQLRNVLLDPNATPEQRSVAQRNLAALSGKSDSWKAVALQGGTDAQGNKTESLLGAVNERTGEMKRMEGRARSLNRSTIMLPRSKRTQRKPRSSMKSTVQVRLRKRLREADHLGASYLLP